MGRVAEREAWAADSPAVSRWQGRVGERTRAAYLYFAHEFFLWAKRNPEDLLDEARADGEGASRVLDLVQEWVLGLRGRRRTKEHAYFALRSFFLHNRCELPGDRSFKVRGEKPPVQGRLKMEDLRRIINAAKLPYRAAFTIMFQGGMGEQEFLYLNENCWSSIRDGLRTEGPIRVDLPGGRKENPRPFYTFIGEEGKRFLREYLERMRGEVGKREAIILSGGRALTARGLRKAFHRLALRLGVIDEATIPCPKCGGETRKVRPPPERSIHYRCRSCGWQGQRNIGEGADTRYGVNPHEMRDLFKSAFHRSGADVSMADFFMGHVIDPLMYDKVTSLFPEYAREQYLKAEPHLSVTREPAALSREEIRAAFIELAQGKVSDEELRQLAERVGSTPQQIRALIRRLKEEPGREEAETEALIEGEKEAVKGKGGDPVKVIRGEKALIEALEDGWRLVKELTGDRYLVQHD